MRHSELRKGNYVYDYYKKVVKVHDVKMDCQMSGFYPGITDGRICYDLSTLSPIDITEEWLTRFGFTKKEIWPSGSGETYKNKDYKDVIIDYSYSERFYMIGLSKSDKVYLIEHVHELQNLFKEMTGQILKED